MNVFFFFLTHIFKSVHDFYLYIYNLTSGFPRTLFQAQALVKKYPPDTVVGLHVPFDVILARVKGRMVHAPSGRIYHTEFNPPDVHVNHNLTSLTTVYIF